jgi:hypothetical protein
MTVQRDFFRGRGPTRPHLVRKNGGIARQWLEKNGHMGNPGLTERPIRYIFRKGSEHLMKILNSVKSAVGICATIIMLAACGGGSPNAGPPASSPSLSSVHHVADFLQKEKLLPPSLSPHHHHKKCGKEGQPCTHGCCKGLQCILYGSKYLCA